MTASLTVSLKTASAFLRGNLTADVRDAKLRFIKSVRSEVPVDLEPGIYRVSAILEDGLEYVELIDLKDHEKASITLPPRTDEVRTGDVYTTLAAASSQPSDVELASLLEDFGAIDRPFLAGPLDVSDSTISAYEAVDDLVVRDLSVLPYAPGALLLSGNLEYGQLAWMPGQTLHFEAVLRDAPQLSSVHVVSESAGVDFTTVEPAWTWRHTPLLRAASVRDVSIFAEASEDTVLTIPGPFSASATKRGKVRIDFSDFPKAIPGINLTTKEGVLVPQWQPFAPQRRDLAIFRDAVTSVVRGTVGVLVQQSIEGKLGHGVITRGLALQRVEESIEMPTTVPGEWAFRSSGNHFGVAEFKAPHGSPWRVSLPSYVPARMRWADQPPGEPDCVVRLPHVNSPPVAYIAAWRTVASTLQHMVHEHRYDEAGNVAHRARDLLLDKYNDPVAAALGAIILFRVGQLDSNEGWLRNLARDFPWLPDGRILLAGLLAARKDSASSADSFQIAVETAGSRALFTESHSILLKLLLRRQKESGNELRRVAALSLLADQYQAIDWGALTLTTQAASA